WRGPSEGGRQIANHHSAESSSQIAQRIHDGGNRAAVISSDIDAHRPRDSDGQLEAAKGDGQAYDGDYRIGGEHSGKQRQSSDTKARSPNREAPFAQILPTRD